MVQKKKRAKTYNKAPDGAVISKIKSILEQRPSYGYRRITALLKVAQKKNQEKCWNHKKVYRVMKQENLLLQRPTHRPKKAHEGKVETLFSNTRWCSDSFSIQCQNGERVHVAFSLDTCDREAMRYIASTIGIDGQAIRDLMLETIEYRLGKTFTEKPVQWLTDNGSCYKAKETVAFGKRLGLDIRTTLPYSPESNGMGSCCVNSCG